MAGGTIALTGTGFAAGMTVTVGGLNCATLAVNSATSATCGAPAMTTSGSKPVVVTVLGQAPTNTLSVSYQRPSISSISMNGLSGSRSGPAGGPMQITGQRFFAGSTAVTINDVPCENVVVTGFTSLTCTVSLSQPVATSQPVKVLVNGQASTAINVDVTAPAV